MLIEARSDPRLFFSDADALLNRCRRTIARAYSRMPQLFNAIPSDELAVKPVQALGAETQGAAYYEAGSADRMAALVVNTSRLNTRPMWEIETLTLHEAVPGHHLQVARAQNNAELPAFTYSPRRPTTTRGTMPQRTCAYAPSSVSVAAGRAPGARSSVADRWSTSYRRERYSPWSETNGNPWCAVDDFHFQ